MATLTTHKKETQEVAEPSASPGEEALGWCSAEEHLPEALGRAKKDELAESLQQGGFRC